MSNFFKNFLYKCFKFGIVGIVSTIINYIIFLFIYKILNVYYIVSSGTGYVFGLISGYLLNRNWTFVNQVDIAKNYFVGYFFVYVVSLISSQVLLFYLVEHLFLIPIYANIYVIGLSTILNFSGTNYFVFKSMDKNRGY